MFSVHLPPDMDVWRHPGDRPLFTRRSHLQEEVALQVALRRQRPQAKFHPSGRGLARRVQEVLL